MSDEHDLEIFLMAVPGLENALCREAQTAGFREAKAVPGGVKVRGSWRDVWRANLELRGAGRVVAKLDSYQVDNLEKLERRARRVPWASMLRPDIPVAIEATCRQSRIYHTGAVVERIASAITSRLGAPVTDDADVVVRVRIERDICTLGIDTSGEPLYKRGYKEAVAKAPLRETTAALLLRECGYDGREAVYDPMCGSGTFVIEAAEMAAGLLAGRARHFAFENLATFDAAEWDALRGRATATSPDTHFYGSDRDAGAIAMSCANAERAGVSAFTKFRQCTVSEIEPPTDKPGLVITNPPYGTRIGDKSRLRDLYRSFGTRLLDRFPGWRVGLITSDAAMAQATGLPFLPPGPPIAHGGLRIKLHRTTALP